MRDKDVHHNKIEIKKYKQKYDNIKYLQGTKANFEENKDIARKTKWCPRMQGH